MRKLEPTIVDEKLFDEYRQEIQKTIMKMFEIEALGLKKTLPKIVSSRPIKFTQ